MYLFEIKRSPKCKPCHWWNKKTKRTRMHSSRMHTARFSGCLSCTHAPLPCTPPCMPPFHHACPLCPPLLPCTHAPLPCTPPCMPPFHHACPLCPPLLPFARHTPLPCTPPLCMPPLPHIPPSPCIPCPLWTEWLTDRYKNITFPQLRLRAVIKMTHIIRFNREWFTDQSHERSTYNLSHRTPRGEILPIPRSWETFQTCTNALRN